jgi:site-specific DNA recombinase
MIMVTLMRQRTGIGRNSNDSGENRKYDAMYARYSSHAQDDGTSIAVQIESCERAAGNPLKHFIDEAKTGRTTGGRTELLRLMQEAEAGRINQLYVYKYDRLGRAAETHVLVEDLEQHGVVVISVTEGTNALARGVQLVVAADYSRVLAERTRDGLVQRHKQGYWTGGPPPYGFRVVETEDGKKKLAIHPDEVATVKFVFESYDSETISLKEVANRVRDRGVPTRLGGPWGFTTVRSILTNRMLLGEVRFLRRCYKLNRATGKRVPRWSDERRHLVTRDESLRIIDDATFERVQGRLAVNSKEHPRDVGELRPFTRHLFCAECGCVYYCRKSKNAKGEYRYYSCGRRMAKRAGECGNAATVREDRLVDRIRAAMTAVFDDTDGVLDEVMAMSREALELNRNELSRLKGEIAEVEKLIAGMTRLLFDSDIEGGAKKAIARQLSEHEAKRDGLRQAMDAVAVQAVADMDDLMADCRQAFMEAKANFASLMSPSQFNRFVADVIGPMAVLPDGRVVQKEAVLTAEAMRTAGIAGAGLEPATSGL